MALTPRLPVDAPQPRGLRYGLLTAAVGPVELPTHGRASGITYEPTTCGFTREYPVECTDPGLKTFDDGNDLVDAEPFVAYATYVCGAAGYTAAELEAKVRRRLMNGEQTSVERALADVIMTSPDTVSLLAPDSTSIAAVIGELEQWIYGDMQYGVTAYLHLPARASAYMAKEHTLIKDGPLWRTTMGTIVVFGGGYPDGIVHITGQTAVWRSEDIFVYPPDQVFDKINNQFNLLAEREYAVAYDCLAASAPFDTGATS